MIGVIIKKEIKEISRQGLFKILSVVMLLLFLTSLFVSTSYYHWLKELQQTAASEARAHWDNQGVKNSHSAAHYGIYLFKPVSTLGLWDNGTDKYAGAGIYIEAHKRNNPQFKAITESPMLARWGELTPSFVLLYLLPLFIIWLGAGFVSKEREQGTFRLLASGGISLKKWMMAKALALWLVATAFISAFFLVAGIVLTIVKGENFFTAATFLLWLVYVLYAGVFANLTLFVSARARSTRSALVSLLMFWLLAVWLVPKGAALAAEQIIPSPTVEAFQKGIQADIARYGIDGHSNQSNERVERVKKYWTKKYGVDSVKDIPVNWVGIILEAGEDSNNVIFDKHYDSLYAKYQGHQQIHEAAGLISPFIPARLSAMALCETDIWHNIHFTMVADAYRKDFIRILNYNLRDNSTYGGRDSQSSSYWKTVKQFGYESPGLSLVWEHYKRTLSVLLLWLIISTVLLVYATKNLKP